MTGKKKNMDGGIWGLVPYQPKYNPETVENKNVNELYTKLTRTEKNLITKNSSLFNRIKAEKNIFFDKQRAEQRFIHFLEILNYKLDLPNIDKKIFEKLYNYFAAINNKYKDTMIKEISKNKGSHFEGLYTEVSKKLDDKKKKFNIQDQNIQKNINYRNKG